MTSLALAAAHARVQLLDLKRSPAFVIFTVAFPAMFFAIFAMPFVRAAAEADEAMLAMMAFAVTGVCLYQFGAGIAAERGRPWERYLRTLPVESMARFAARIACAALAGLAAAGLVALVARLFTPVDLSGLQWIAAFAFALLGAVPFVAIGLAIGYWVSARAAVPIATASNLLLAYMGGLWIPPQYLPRDVQAISPYLPTRAFADLLWSVTSGRGAAAAVVLLAAYAALFLAVASIAYRRDERKRYA
ncbi:MAG TPA: ABC transporter permease [Verrucomicrobiae bacterium]|nr:ABC transporter permease [Verrucomicrobiae bacterium]